MIGNSRFLVLYLLLSLVGLFLHLHDTAGVPIKKPFDSFPTALGGWRMSSESRLSDSVQAVLKASDTLMRQYVDARGEKVELYIGYHDGGKDSGEIHSPKHCLPGSGWLERSSIRTELPAPGGRLNLVRAVYQKGDSKELFLYWYQVRAKSISQEYALKVAQVGNSLLCSRRDASFIRISVPFEDDEVKACAVAESFVRDFLPSILGFLPA